MSSGEYEKTGAEDTEFLSDFNWSRVVGKRFEKTCEFIGSDHIQAKLLLYSVVFSTFKYLTAWCLTRTHTSGCATHPLLDLVSDQYSPVLRCMQYCRCLLTSDSSDRLFAVIMFCQSSSKHAFVESHPLSHTCVTSVKAAAGWFFWRSLRFKRGPYSFAKVSDHRVAASEKLREVNELFGQHQCCHDMACTLKLVKRVTRPEQLLDPRNVQVAAGIARLPVHNAVVETLHARNQTKAASNTSWSLFVARFLNEQAMYVMRLTDRAWQHAMKSLLPPADTQPKSLPLSLANAATAATPSRPTADPDWLPGCNGKQVFYQKCVRLDKAAGRSCRPATGPYWKSVNNRWALAGAAEQHALTLIGKHNAAAPRKGAATTSVAIAPAASTGPTLTDICEPCTSVFMMPRLRKDAKCPTCSITGDVHPAPLQRFDMILRHQAHTISVLSAAKESAKSNTPPGLATLPLSRAAYTAERTKWRGGLKAIAEKFDNSVMQTGRDTGIIPEDQPPLRRCKFGLCMADLSKSGGSVTVYKQLVATMKQLVSSLGGPSKVPSKMP